MSELITIGEPLGVFAADGECENDKKLSETTHFKKFLAGAEVNVSVGTSRLGHSVQYITKLGKDPFGEFIRECLKVENVGTEYIGSTDKYFTGVEFKSKVTKGDPDTFYLRKNSAASNISLDDLKKLDLNGVKHIHLTGIFAALSKSTRDVSYKLLELAKGKNIRTTFDPNLRPALWQNKEDMINTLNNMAFRSDIVLPGVNEGKILMGSDNPDEIADFYLKRGVKLAIIKLGSKGAFVKSKDEKFVLEGFRVKKVVDTVGAGDGFAVGVITGLLENLSIRDTVQRANAIGAMAVMSSGDNDGYPTHEELKRFLENK